MAARILPFPATLRREVPRSVFAFDSRSRRSDFTVRIQEPAEPDRLTSETLDRWRAETADHEPSTP